MRHLSPLLRFALVALLLAFAAKFLAPVLGIRLPGMLQVEPAEQTTAAHERELHQAGVWKADRQETWSLAQLKDLMTRESVVFAFASDDHLAVTTKAGRLSLSTEPLGIAAASESARERATAKVMDLFEAKGAPLEFKRAEPPSMLWTVIPLALLTGFLFSAAGPLLARRRAMLGSVGKNVSDATRPKVTFEDVIGAQDAKEALGDIVAYLKDPAKFHDAGLPCPRGVLLTGDPGVGKTMLAKALAGEAGVSFISTSGADFTGKYFGVGVEKVKRLFEVAREAAPCVVFVDEMDGIGRRVVDAERAADVEQSRIVEAFLVEMDGFDTGAGVIFIGATNHEDALDEAIRRPGRLDRVVRVELPTRADRESLFDLYLRKMKSLQLVGLDLPRLARQTAGMSPAGIANTVQQAATMAFRRGRELTQADMEEALEREKLGAVNKALVLDAETKRRIAHHEAGHALLAAMLKSGTVDKVTVIPRGSALGLTLLSPTSEVPLQTEQEMHDRLEVLLGGRCAEELFCDGISTGAGHDLQEASKLAYSMVAAYGFSRKGLFSVAGLPKGAPAEMAGELVAEANELLSAARARCLDRLKNARGSMELLVAQLIEHETVDGSVVHAALKEQA